MGEKHLFMDIQTSSQEYILICLIENLNTHPSINGSKRKMVIIMATKIVIK
jgi:hypothetical protein